MSPLCSPLTLWEAHQLLLNKIPGTQHASLPQVRLLTPAPVIVVGEGGLRDDGTGTVPNP